MAQIDLGKVIGPQGPQGAVGPAGEQGPRGAAATINGVPALELKLAGGLTGGQTAQGVYTISSAAMGEVLQHVRIAYDMMTTIYQAELRDAQKRIEALEAKAAALAS